MYLSLQFSRVLFHSAALARHQVRIMYGNRCLRAQCLDQFNVTRIETRGMRISDQESAQDSTLARAQLYTQVTAHRDMTARNAHIALIGKHVINHYRVAAPEYRL